MYIVLICGKFDKEIAFGPIDKRLEAFCVLCELDKLSLSGGPVAHLTAVRLL